MNLGNFSVSLAVKDLQVSKAFYEKLGFEVFGGDALAELVNHEERRSRHRSVSGHVRQERADVQSRDGTPTPRSSTASPTFGSSSASSRPPA